MVYICESLSLSLYLSLSIYIYTCGCVYVIYIGVTLHKEFSDNMLEKSGFFVCRTQEDALAVQFGKECALGNAISLSLSVSHESVIRAIRTIRVIRVSKAYYRYYFCCVSKPSNPNMITLLGLCIFSDTVLVNTPLS